MKQKKYKTNGSGKLVEKWRQWSVCQMRREDEGKERKMAGGKLDKRKELKGDALQQLAFRGLHGGEFFGNIKKKEKHRRRGSFWKKSSEGF